MYRDTIRRSEMYSCKINFICKDGAPRMKQFACLCEAFVAPEGLLLCAIIHLHCLPQCGSALLVAWTNVVLSSNVFCGNFMNIIHNMCSKIKINTTSFPVQKRFFFLVFLDFEFQNLATFRCIHLTNSEYISDFAGTYSTVTISMGPFHLPSIRGTCR